MPNRGYLLNTLVPDTDTDVTDSQPNISQIHHGLHKFLAISVPY